MTKNDTTFSRMRSSDHLGDSKMSKKDIPRRRVFMSVMRYNILTKLGTLIHDDYG